MKIDKQPIADKIQELIKKKIVEEGLVKSGNLLNSIVVKPTSKGFSIEAEDYYTYLDEEYNITNEVFDSTELIIFIEDYLVNEFEKNIK